MALDIALLIESCLRRQTASFQRDEPEIRVGVPIRVVQRVAVDQRVELDHVLIDGVDLPPLARSHGSFHLLNLLLGLSATYVPERRGAALVAWARYRERDCPTIARSPHRERQSMPRLSVILVLLASCP